MSENLLEPEGQSPAIEALEAMLLKTLGAPFIAYATNASIQEIRRRLTSADAEKLADQQENVLLELAHVTASIAAMSQVASEFMPLHLARLFGTFDTRSRSSLINSLRLSAGGTLWEPEASEGPEYELLALLKDIHPLLLFPADKSPFVGSGGELAAPSYDHPRRLHLEQALLAHPVFKQLFATESSQSGPHCTLYTSAGNAGGVHLNTFAAGVIRTAWELALLSSTFPTVEQHAQGLTKALGIIENAVQGKAATVPVQVGLTGVLFPEDIESMDIGWAKMRISDERDENSIIERTLPGAVQATDADGTSIEVKYRGNLIVQMNIPYRVKIDEVDFPSELPEGFSPIKLIQKRIQNIQLGLLLSNDLDPRAMVMQSWQRIIDPLASTGFSWRSAEFMRNIHPRRLTTGQVEDWKTWATLIAENRQKSVDVAIRRILMAVSERNSLEDSLVDAVVVWENLFGGVQETTMRVTASLAWLLGNGVEDRKIRQAEYKKIYVLRSGVVHGAIEELKKREDQKRPRQAINTAIEALRKLFLERPDLLGAPDSATRSNRLLLGD